MTISEEINAAVPDIEAGKKYHLYYGGQSTLVHVRYVLPSHDGDSKLIVYSYFGKYKRWWHDVMKKEISFKQEVLFHQQKGKK